MESVGEAPHQKVSQGREVATFTLLEEYSVPFLRDFVIGDEEVLLCPVRESDIT